MSALLSVENLCVQLSADSGRSGAASSIVENVSLGIERGEALGLVGESGCGKSTLLLAVLDLLGPEMLRTSGDVLFDGRNLTLMDEAVRRRLLGKEIGVVFQEPTRALNPVLKIGEQVAEVLRCHEGMDKRAAWSRAVELLDEVGIEQPALRARDYPHQLSGGMNQRVVIAMATACSPALLVVDEPTTALDVTVQKEILALFRRLREERGMALLFVSHDLALVEREVDRVAVMYAGSIVESAPTSQLFARPRHPYTRGLLDCQPKFAAPHSRLPEIGGVVPASDARPWGCAFHPRCASAESRCRSELPSLTTDEAERTLACFYPLDGADSGSEGGGAG